MKSGRNVNISLCRYCTTLQPLNGVSGRISSRVRRNKPPGFERKATDTRMDITSELTRSELALRDTWWAMDEFKKAAPNMRPLRVIVIRDKDGNVSAEIR